MSAEESLLRLLVEAPLADRLEMADISGWSRSAVYRCIETLSDAGLVEYIPHASPLIAPTRRFVATMDGLVRVAEMEGVSVEHLLRTRPVSEEHLRLLIARLDAVAVLYRVASAAAVAARPIKIAWRRGAPQDADLNLPGGQTLSLLRIGATADRTSSAKRLYRFVEGSPGRTALVVVPDEVRMRHTRRLLANASATAFIAFEKDTVAASCDDPVWKTPATNAELDLRTVLDCIGSGPASAESDLRIRASAPAVLDFDRTHEAVPAWLLPAYLCPSDKAALDVIFDWPWISAAHLAALLGVRRSRISEVLQRLADSGLVERRKIRGCSRLAVSDLGITTLGRRDRVSVGALKKRWSASVEESDDPEDWRSVEGRRSRQLLRNIDHTEAVHTFVARLARQARAKSLEIVQFDPPSKSSRFFRFGPSVRSIHPDAYGALRSSDATTHFFLEWERRAVRPSTMAARVAPYIRYFGSGRPLDDHGAMPVVLVVFEERVAQSTFVRIARREMDGAGVDVPMLVSRRDLVEELGPLGPVWTRVGRDRSPSVFPLR